MRQQESLLSESRIEVDFHEIGFDDQLFLGRYHHTRATKGLHEHHHPHMMEICYLASGMQVYEVDGQRYVLRGNDVFVTFPDEEHSSGGFPQEKGVLYWLQVRIPRGNEPLLLLPHQATEPLCTALSTLPQRSFNGSPRLPRLLDAVFLAYQQHTALTPLLVASKIMEFLLEVISCAQNNARVAPPDDITRVLTYIDEQLSQSLPVSDLAEVAQLSPSRLKAKFKEQVGVPPAEYILRRKIEHAKQLLPHHSVTEVAYTLGFSSSQYFATVFKRFTNQRPREYAATR